MAQQEAKEIFLFDNEIADLELMSTPSEKRATRSFPPRVTVQESKGSDCIRAVSIRW